MGIGYRIKEARENLGFTQTELGKMVGVTGSAITNYETETSHPREPIMYKLIEALKVDANYLFQDCVKLPKEANDVTLAEYEHIKKYRSLDPHGQQTVEFILDRELERVTRSKEAQDRIAELERQATILPLKDATAEYLGNAAHARTDIEATDEMREHDDAIMDGEDF